MHRELIQFLIRFLAILQEFESVLIKYLLDYLLDK